MAKRPRPVPEVCTKENVDPDLVDFKLSKEKKKRFRPPLSNAEMDVVCAWKYQKKHDLGFAGFKEWIAHTNKSAGYNETCPKD